MDLSLEKLTQRQKIVALVSVALVLVIIILLIVSLINNNKVKAPEVDTPVSSANVIPQEKPEPVNDITSDTGVLVDYSKYPTYSFSALNLTDVMGSTKVANPPVQYDGQPRAFIDCGRLISTDTKYKNTLKKACVFRQITDGAIIVIGSDVENDYIYYKGKTRDEKTETLVKDISTTGNKTYLIYEYDYGTQSSNYIDRISLVIPQTLQIKDLEAFETCVDKPTVAYADDTCYAIYGKEWYDSNSYYLEHKDNYFRAVNLP